MEEGTIRAMRWLKRIIAFVIVFYVSFMGVRALGFIPEDVIGISLDFPVATVGFFLQVGVSLVLGLIVAKVIRV